MTEHGARRYACNPLPRLTTDSQGDRETPRNVWTVMVPFEVMAALMVVAAKRQQWPWQRQGQLTLHLGHWRCPQRHGACIGSGATAAPEPL